jgi:ribosome-binding factor A
MAKKRRIYRVGEQLQNLIATHLQRMSDPRLYLVTITSVVVSSDLRHAKVYWVATKGKERKNEIDDAFVSAASYIRTAIAKDLGIRMAPQLRFYYDDTLDTQEHVLSLFSRIQSLEEQ